jgi:flagellin-specific chaperone FliS
MSENPDLSSLPKVDRKYLPKQDLERSSHNLDPILERKPLTEQVEEILDSLEPWFKDRLNKIPQGKVEFRALLQVALLENSESDVLMFLYATLQTELSAMKALDENNLLPIKASLHLIKEKDIFKGRLSYRIYFPYIHQAQKELFMQLAQIPEDEEMNPTALAEVVVDNLINNLFLASIDQEKKDRLKKFLIDWLGNFNLSRETAKDLGLFLYELTTLETLVRQNRAPDLQNQKAAYAFVSELTGIIDHLRIKLDPFFPAIKDYLERYYHQFD